MICHGYFAFGPLSIRNAAAKSSSDYRIDFGACLHPLNFLDYYFTICVANPKNLEDLLANPGQKGPLRGVMLKTPS